MADYDGDGDIDAYISKTNGAANTVFLIMVWATSPLQNKNWAQHFLMIAALPM